MGKTQSMNFVKEVSQVLGGEGVNLVCSAVHVLHHVRVHTYEYTPSEIIAMVRAEMRMKSFPAVQCGVAFHVIPAPFAAPEMSNRQTCSMLLNHWRLSMDINRKIPVRR